MAVANTLRLVTLKLRNSRFAKSFKYLLLMTYFAIMVLVATYIFNKSHDLLRTNNKTPMAVQKVDVRDEDIGEAPQLVLKFEGLVRPGLGDNGRGVVLSQEQSSKDIQAQMKSYSYNKYVSDRISVRRLLPDTRHRECRTIDYDKKDLPKASVILIFCNETLSALMRTVHSVIEQTPADLLHEVVLIDDGSGSEEITQVHSKCNFTIIITFSLEENDIFIECYLF